MHRLVKVNLDENNHIDNKYRSAFKSALREFNNPDEKKRFFHLIEYLYVNIGNLHNKRELSNKTGISFKQLDECFSILKKHKLFFKIFPFFTDPKDENSQHFKVYAEDINLIEFMEERLWKKVSHGLKVENYVCTTLKKLPYKLRTYKKISGNEIDFILVDKDGSIIPIEIKSGNSVSIHKGFSEFMEKYNKKINYFVKTTKSKNKRKYMGDKTIHYVPFEGLNDFIMLSEKPKKHSVSYK